MDKDDMLCIALGALILLAGILITANAEASPRPPPEHPGLCEVMYLSGEHYRPARYESMQDSDWACRMFAHRLAYWRGGDPFWRFGRWGWRELR